METGSFLETDIHVGRTLGACISSRSAACEQCKDITTRQRATAQMARTKLYTDDSLCIMEELRDVFTTINNQREFQIEAIRAVVLSPESDNWTMPVK